jgi:hypothetical protein
MKHVGKGSALRLQNKTNASDLVLTIAYAAESKKKSKRMPDGKHVRYSCALFDEETMAHARWLLEKGHKTCEQVADWLGVDINYVRTSVRNYITMVMVLPRQSLHPHLLPRRK